MANSAVIGNLKALLMLDTTNFDKGVTASIANSKKLAGSLEKDLIPSQAKINALIRDFAGNRDIARALELSTAIHQVGGATKLTAAEQQRANRVIQEALDKYRALGQQAPQHLIDLAKATQQVTRATGQMKASAQEASGQFGAMLGKVNSVGSLFGLTLGVGAVVSFTKSVVTAAGSIKDAADKASVSTDAIQQWRYAAEQTGATMDDVTNAATTMQDKLAGGDRSVVRALKSAGLEINELRAMKPEDAFYDIVQAISMIPDPMEQVRVSIDLLGKTGKEMLPAIRQGFIDMARAAPVSSREVIESLDEIEDRWGEVKARLERFGQGAVVTAADLYDAGFNIGDAYDFFADLFAGRLGDTDFDKRQARAPRRRRLVSALPSETDAVQAFDARHGTLEAQLDKAQRLLDEPLRIIRDLTGENHRQRLRELATALKGLQIDDLTLDGWRRLREELDRLERLGQRIPASLERFRLPDLPMRAIPLDSLTGGRMTFAREASALFLAEGQAIRDRALHRAPVPPMSVPMKAIEIGKLFGDGLNIEDMMRGVDIPPDRLAKLLASGVGGALKQVSNVVLASITGGGNIGEAVGALFGQSIGKGIVGKVDDTGLFESGLGRSLQGVFPKKVGGFIADFIPGLGALLGPALGKLFSVIGGIGQNTTKHGREDFAKQLGFESLGNLHAKLQSLGAEGEKLANISLNVVGKKDKAANEKWMKDVTAFFDRLERVPGKVNELTSALGRFGGAVPQSLDATIDTLLGNSALSADLKKQLAGMKTPTWQAAQELAASFGIQSGALGAGFNQARLAESAFDAKRALDVFGRFQGSDRDAILRDMADEFSGMASEAQKNKVALPEAVREFVRRVDEMGLLLDENGQRIDSSLLQFANIEDEHEKQVVSLLEEIRNLLAGAGAGAAVPVSPEFGPVAGIGGWSTRRGYDPSVATPLELPGFAGGTHGQFLDFGPGTPVLLHGHERVMTRAEGLGDGNTYVIQAMDARSFETWLRRGASRAVLRTLPIAVRQAAVQR